MRQLLESGIHFGHQTRRWHPKMKRYIYGQRNGIYIIDLQHTLRQMYRAYGMVRETASKGGTVLFVGTKRQAQEVVQTESQRCGMYYVTSRWLGGTLTNFRTCKLSINELTRLQDLEATGKIEKYSKREASEFRKERERLERNLGGIQHMPGLPDLMFVASVKNENIAVQEGRRLGIPVMGIVDTNCDPDLVDIPIPGNDDAIRALGLYCSVLADAAIEGRMKFQKGRVDQMEEQMLATEGSDEAVAEAIPAEPVAAASFGSDEEAPAE
jgi:small subunit ribosomal protein S2